MKVVVITATSYIQFLPAVLNFSWRIKIQTENLLTIIMQFNYYNFTELVIQLLLLIIIWNWCISYPYKITKQLRKRENKNANFSGNFPEQI